MKQLSQLSTHILELLSRFVHFDGSTNLENSEGPRNLLPLVNLRKSPNQLPQPPQRTFGLLSPSYIKN